MNFSKYTGTDTPAFLKTFAVDPAVGLSSVEVETRRKEYGLNQLAESKVHPWQIFIRQFKSVFIYLLLGAAGLSFALNQMTEGWMILFFILINASLGFYQEYRSEQTVELLRRYITIKVKARRNGKVSIIDASELVPGDIVIIEAGDGIPADIRIIEDLNLTVNEEPLTGESVPMKKESAPLTHIATELYEAKNIGFSGTTVVSGRGLGIVFATGMRTMIGDITDLAGGANHESRFEQELGKFSKFILYLVVGTLAFIFVANLLIKGWDADIASLAIFSIALAVSVVPEALPIVMTFSLSRGARRLAKNRVVVKRLSAIEDLGSIQILCTDKTGTITENKLTVHETYGEVKSVILFAANMGGSYIEMYGRGSVPDPFDTALWESLSANDQIRLASHRVVSNLPFDPVRKKVSALLEHEGMTTLVVRGAPESILDDSTESTEERARILAWAAEEGRAGRRTIAVASKMLSSGDYDDTRDEAGLSFIGCISFIDPIKASAKQAIKDAIELRVGIKIITGDSKEVAGQVAFDVGLAKAPTDVISARELFELNDEEQMDRLERFNVFSRVSPAEKYKIIELFQKKYEVGFLGEGINDAPALKIANVAIVVPSASDIAREAADIILLDRSLSVVIGGIREGRVIFANTTKYITSTLSSNFGNFYAIAISSLFIPFLPMLPLQILLVNLLSDFPAIAIATDSVDPEELSSPKQYDIRKIIMFGTALGIVSTVFDFITFAHFSRLGAEMLQTHWFMVSILTEILFLYSIRSRKLFWKTKAPSFILTTLSILAIITTVTIPFTSFGQSMFGFIRPSLGSMGVVLAIVAAYFITTEIAKLLYHRFVITPTAHA